MKKFIILYMAPSEVMAKSMENTTPEERKKEMEKWVTWSKSHPEIDMGMPLGKNVRVTKDGASPAANDIGGYSFVEAESAEAAAELLADCPFFDDMPNTYIEVMECVNM